MPLLSGMSKYPYLSISLSEWTYAPQDPAHQSKAYNCPVRMLLATAVLIMGSLI